MPEKTVNYVHIFPRQSVPGASLHFAALATASLPQSHREPSGGGMGRKFAATLGGERSVRGKPKTRYVSVSYEGLG